MHLLALFAVIVAAIVVGLWTFNALSRLAGSPEPSQLSADAEVREALRRLVANEQRGN